MNDLKGEEEDNYDNNNNNINNTKHEYIPPHKAKLIQIPENGIELPFNIISSSNSNSSSQGLPQSYSKQSEQSANNSSNLILSTSQFKFPRKTTTNTSSTSSNKSISIPIETEEKFNFKIGSGATSNSILHNPSRSMIDNSNLKTYTMPGIVNNQAKFSSSPSSSSFIDNNLNSPAATNTPVNISNQKKPSLFLFIKLNFYFE
jgi:hypothetical protein